MKDHLKNSIILFALTLVVGNVTAQENRVVSGSVTDQVTGAPLPFAPVSLKKNLSGVVANEEGKFDLRVPAGAENDTIVVNVFGYRRHLFPVTKAVSPLAIALQQNVNEIEEVKVLPQPPEHYIRLAMRNLKRNYPTVPFESVSYYREKIMENKNFVQCDEAVFRTYCTNYLDTIKNQDQLLLFRRADNTRPIAFMTEDKKTRKAKRKGKPLPADTSRKKSTVSIGSFGGPEAILKSSKPGKGWNFLDTTELKEYRYKFGASTSFNDRDVMVIEFVSRGKVDHVRESGKIYLDMQNYAIMRIENSGEFVIPVLIRPVLFMAGLDIDEPRYSRDLEFQFAEGRWYPQKVLYDVSGTITKRYMFSPNERSFFEIDQVFAVNRLEVKEPRSVDPAKRFKSDKPMAEQVQNDQGLSWEQVNTIRK